MAHSISPSVFEKEFSALSERFPQALSSEIVKRYYQVLDQELTEKEFLFASARVFIEDDFFPSPKKFIEKVRSAGEQGLDTWADILRATSTGKEPEMLDAAKKAIATIGGFKAVKDCNTQTQLPHFRRDFLSAFEIYYRATITPLPDAPKTRDEILGLIGVELRSLGMNAVLPLEWQVDYAQTASHLNKEDAQEYLEWLRSKSNAIVPI